MRRYNRDQRISGGKLQSAQAVSRIRRARDFGLLPTKEVILQSSQRLDHLAHEYLGDSYRLGNAITSGYNSTSSHRYGSYQIDRGVIYGQC